MSGAVLMLAYADREALHDGGEDHQRRGRDQERDQDLFKPIENTKK